MQVKSAQLPPIQHSADKLFTSDNAVILLDGASAFVPVPVSASTYADHLGKSLHHSLSTYPDADLRASLAWAIQEAAQELGLDPAESPSSTVTIVRELDDHLDLLVLGDNLLVLPDETVTDDRVDRLDLPPRRKYRERLAAGTGYDEEHRAVLRELQTQQAQRRNRVGGYWTAGTDPAAAWQAVTRRRSSSATPWVVLASDGAYNTMHHLGITDWPALVEADAEELTTTLMRCQCWEATDDPMGIALPRAKCHGDKSLAVLTFAE
ncbi:hypothetical protein SAMN05216266_101397 [Amycolatopsis marina]|uniref:Protein phosphatase 2C n=1 Tax=Amycolatopsis marina TaxID=490629 RepID=A0A1I0VQI3_9PSEU|nr:hypothetical protein [Amycolatopsis marina]SFA78253.1 hypothetical protein SAMN05216266_101397 [Amycolatopsis marina]